MITYEGQERSRPERSHGPQRTTVWLVSGEKVTVMESVDVVASALTNKPCQLVALPLDSRGLEVVYVNGDQVTHMSPAGEAGMTRSGAARNARRRPPAAATAGV